jgi:hypothetical protein
VPDSRLGSTIGVITGVDGRFRIGGLPPGTQTLSIYRPPFLAAARRVKLASDQTLAGWRVELARSLEISGKVEDQDGFPAEDCPVEVLRYVYRNGQRKLELWGAARTNDRGEYWVGGLEPGRYYVRVAPLGSLYFWDQRYGVSYHPDAVTMDGAHAVELAPDLPSAVADIHMMRRKGVRLTGEVVVPETGLPPNRAIGVSMVYEDDRICTGIWGRLVDRAFAIEDVPPGAYVLRAEVDDPTPQGAAPGLSAYQHVSVGTSDMGGFVLRLEPHTPRDVPAKVTIESGVEARRIAH